MSMTYKQAHDGVQARWGSEGRIRLLRDVALPKRYQVGYLDRSNGNFVMVGGGDDWDEAFSQADSGNTPAVAQSIATRLAAATPGGGVMTHNVTVTTVAAPKAQKASSNMSAAAAAVASAPFTYKIDTKLLGFDEITMAAALAAFAGEHLLMIGTPGVAKSLFARRFFDHFEGERFETQFTKFADESVLYGAPNMKAMRETGEVIYEPRMFASAHWAFIDEIFDGSDVLMRCSLSGLQERKFLRGAKAIDMPLQTCIATANYTRVNEVTAAVVDRFIMTVGSPVLSVAQKVKLYDGINFEEALTPKKRISLEQIESVRAKSKSVKVAETLARAIVNWADGFGFTPRRHRKLSTLLKVNAALNGRSEVNEDDIMVSRFVLPLSQSGTVDNSAKQVQPLKDSIVKALNEGVQLKQVQTLSDVPPLKSSSPADVIAAMKACKAAMLALRGVNSVSDYVEQNKQTALNNIMTAYTAYEQNLGLN